MDVLLTGASSGIGEACVKLLAAQGHRAVAVARRDEKLQELAAKTPNHVFPFSADVTDAQAMVRAVDFAHEKFGTLDAVIPNAGIGYFAPLGDGQLSHWHEMVNVNITGVMNTIHPALPHLKASKGTVVLIGSVAARQVFQNSGIYCMTKHAVLALAEAVRQDCRGEVAVSVVNPGAVDTAFIERTPDEALKAEYRPNFTAGLSPEMVAEQILHVLTSRGRGVISELTIRPEFAK